MVVIVSLNLRRVQAILLSGLFALSAATVAQGNAWMPVTGTETLRNFMSDRTAERTLPGGEVSRGEYRPDGTGTLYAWGRRSQGPGQSRATIKSVLPRRVSPNVTRWKETPRILNCTARGMQQQERWPSFV